MSAAGGLLPPVVVRLLGDMTQLRGTLAQARAQVDGTAKGFQAAGATAFAGMAKMGRSVSLIGAGVAVASTKMAGDFQAETMVLHTAAGETLKNLGTVRKGILDIASGTGTDWRNLTDGMYQVEKAGYRGADGLKVLKAAAQGAREENAHLDTVTNAMTSVMASYHLKASDSVRVMNALKTAAGEGKMTMEQFSSSLSTVLPIASANKISLEEVTGALATLTQHGTSAREGTQELASTIRQLASPNNVAVQEMQRFGLSATDVSTKLGKRGLTGTLDLLTTTVLGKMGPSGTILLSAFNKTKQAAADADEMVKAMPKSIQGLARSYAAGAISLGDWRQKLKELPPEQANLLSQYATLRNKTTGFSAELKRGGPAAKTYTDAIRKMTGGAIGLNTTLQLTGENTEGFKERVKKVGESFHNTSKDVEGWEETQKLFNVQMDKAKQTINVLMIEIGTKLIPVVTSVVAWFGRHKDVAVALAAVIGGVLTLSVAAFAVKTAASVLKPLGALAKLGAGGVKAGARVVQGFRSAQVAGSAFSGKAGSFGGALRKMWDGSIRGAKSAGRAVGSFGKTLGGLAARGGKAAFTGLASGLRATAGAMRLAGSAALSLSRRMAAATLTALRSAGAWALQRVRLIAAAVAEKAAAVAQWLLNAAMSANPIMLVVLAIAALVAGLIWAYTKVGWFRDFVDAAFKLIGQAVSWCVDFVKAHWPLLLGILLGPIGVATGMIIKHWDKIRSGFLDAYHGTVNAGKALISWIAGLPGRAGKALASLASQIVSVASAAWTSFKTSSVKRALETVAWIQGLPGRARKALGNLGSLLYSAGADMLRGLLNGIKSINVSRVLSGIAHGAVASFKSALGIKSPSRVFQQLGVYINTGLVDGLTGSTAKVQAATRRVESLLMQTYNKVANLKGVKGKYGASNAWVKSHEATIKRLEAYAKKEDKVLRGLAAKRDTVAKKIKDAQKKLSDLQKQWSDEVKSISQGIMQGFSVITEAPQEGFALTAQDVTNKMRDQMVRAVQFAAQLDLLRKKGLRSDLIEQLAAAGVEQGGATAAALVGASKGQITEINKLQATTVSAANTAGKAVADSMYGSGIKAAQGLVKGLQSQQKAIEKQMLSIAKSMQQAIKKALGIKSPSRVFASIGQWIPRGLAAGVEDASHHATRAVTRLAGSVAGAGSFPGTGLAMAGAGNGGGAVVHNHFTFQIEGNAVTMDKLSKDVESAFLRRGMRNPLTYQQYKR
ncbi:phage tail tape measure protein [Streptomyces nodosus]|uniref:phage tail tape measure protein n=1 Tax=Streptomyces nodosus TaxID=40318 RepID=UPI0036E9794D